MEATQAMLLAGLYDSHDEVVCAAISGLGRQSHPSALPGAHRKLSQISSLD
ncbi:MAG: hypothetical protein V4805_05570 [Pseudomonadota bacterium]